MTGMTSDLTILCRLLFEREIDDVAGQTSEALENPVRARSIASIANASFVSGSLWVRLNEYGLTDRLSADVRDYLQAFYALNEDRNTHILRQFRESVESLNHIGISPMPLKGTAHLVDGLYDSPACRFLSDIDLLVPQDRTADAAAALKALGYRHAEISYDLSNHHHLAPMVRTLDDVAIEIHSAPASARQGAAAIVGDIRERALPENQDGLNWLRVAATDSVMLVFLHNEVMDYNIVRHVLNLRGFLDWHHLCQERGHEIDWQEIQQRLEQVGQGASYRRFRYFYASLSGSRLPGDVPLSWRDRIRLALCRAVIRWPNLRQPVLETHKSVRKLFGVARSRATADISEDFSSSKQQIT
jgi:hypothetical protein